MGEIERRADDKSDATAMFDLMKRWTAGEAVSGRTFSNLIYNDEDEGLLLHTTSDCLTAAAPAWNAFVTAAMYVAWQAYRQAGEPGPSDVSEVGEDTLDLLDSQWRETGSYDPDYIGRAIKLLATGTANTDVDELERRLKASRHR